MIFKTDDVVMWCGRYGDIFEQYDTGELLVRFEDEAGHIFHFNDKGEKCGTDYVSFPHFPKLEHAQRPDTFPRTIHFRVAITDIMARLEDKSYTRANLWKHYGFCIKEFNKHFEIAKRASEEGDYATTKKFFNIYC